MYPTFDEETGFRKLTLNEKIGLCLPKFGHCGGKKIRKKLLAKE